MRYTSWKTFAETEGQKLYRKVDISDFDELKVDSMPEKKDTAEASMLRNKVTSSNAEKMSNTVHFQQHTAIDPVKPPIGKVS